MEIVSNRPSLPLLMLSEKEGSHEREFYSLSERQISMSLDLPEAAGKRCIEAGFGWLLTLANSGEVQLLNPFSRSQIEVPNFKTFPDYSTADGIKDPESAFIERAVLSANPSQTSDLVLVVTTFEHLGFWKMGDENWTRIGDKIYPGDVNYCTRDRKFYAVNVSGYIYAWNSGDLGVTEKIMRMDEKVTGTCYEGAQSYLVESTKGELLLVVRNGSSTWSGSGNRYWYGTSKFKVFRIDVEKRNYKEITSLDDDAVFVGHNAAYSVSASKFPSVIKPNSVYFTDDSMEAYSVFHMHCKKCEKLHYGGRHERCERNHETVEDEKRALMKKPLDKRPWVWENQGKLDAMKGGGKNMGIYNFENGTIHRFDPSLETLSLVCPPLWVSPASSS